MIEPPAAGTTATPCPRCGAESTGPRCLQCGITLRVGNVVVTRVVVERALSRTYLGTTAEGQKVALKELAFSTSPTGAQLAMFERETSSLQLLDHPALPKFLGRFHDGRGPEMRLYLARSWREGDSLAAITARTPLKEGRIRAVASVVLDLLQYLHTRQPRVLHRDVKAANILIDGEGQVSLVDFGLSRMLSDEQTSEATDIAGVGLTVASLLSGQSPAELARNPRGFDPGPWFPISPAFREWIEEMIAHPAPRFASAALAWRALDRAFAPAPPPAEAPPPVEVPASAPRLRFPSLPSFSLRERAQELMERLSDLRGDPDGSGSSNTTRNAIIGGIVLFMLLMVHHFWVTYVDVRNPAGDIIGSSYKIDRASAFKADILLPAPLVLPVPFGDKCESVSRARVVTVSRVKGQEQMSAALPVTAAITIEISDPKPSPDGCGDELSFDAYGPSGPPEFVTVTKLGANLVLFLRTPQSQTKTDVALVRGEKRIGTIRIDLDQRTAEYASQ